MPGGNPKLDEAGGVILAPAAAAPPPTLPDAALDTERRRRLQRATLELCTLLDAAGIWELTLRHAIDLLEADAASLWLAEQGTLRCHLTFGEDAAADAAPSIPIEALDRLALPAAGAPVAAAPIRLDGEVRAVVRVQRSLAGGAPIGLADRECLEELAESAAAALRVAERYHAAASRAQALALVAEMSREITATLDLDRVLRAVVNLAGRGLTFDRGAVALYEKGECDIRAVAGADTVDRADPRLKDLAVRAAWAAGMGESFYLSDRRDAASDAERIFVQIFGSDLEAAGMCSGLYLPLRDEEGIVGILLFESSRTDFAKEHERELASVLANQATVAIRNAQLYSHVPLADVLGALRERKQALLALPRQRRMAYAAAAAAVLAAVTLIRWPLRVPAADPVFYATGRVDVRPLVPGVVERVLVREGDVVRRGDVLAQLRDAELRSERDALQRDAEAAERSAALAASRGDAGADRMHQLRAATLRQEAGVLDEQVRATTVRAPVPGLVLTPRLEERLGAHLDAGQALLLVGRTDTLELEFAVSQRDVARIRPGDPLRLRVDALPQRTFEGRVVWIGAVPADTTDGVTFPVRALVPNADGLLRPGMVPYARVLTAPASIAERVLRDPVRWARLLWWRVWP